MDEHTALFWLLLTILCLCIQAFFSMLEMASVSLNKARLQFYVSQNSRRAKWLDHLLQKPSRLFGTTLVMVNITLQVGSECSRQFYIAFDLSPEIAPLTQVFLVVVLAELAPMLAARRYAEHVAMLGSPILYFTSKLMTPIIIMIGFVSRCVNKIINPNNEEGNAFFLSREELQEMFETQTTGAVNSKDNEEVNLIVSNIFKFRHKSAKEVMEPLNAVQMVPSNCTILHLRDILKQSHSLSIPIYHKSRTNIIGIAFPRDLLKIPDNEAIRRHSHPPWFVTQNSNVVDILQQFRSNKKSVAIVLNDVGNAIGTLSLNDILDEIFGEFSLEEDRVEQQHLIEKTFPGNMRLDVFNKQFNSEIVEEGVETLAELMVFHLEHPPRKGDLVLIDHFELRVEEASLLEIKTILVKSI